MKKNIYALLKLSIICNASIDHYPQRHFQTTPTINQRVKKVIFSNDTENIPHNPPKIIHRIHNKQQALNLLQLNVGSNYSKKEIINAYQLLLKNNISFEKKELIDASYSLLMYDLDLSILQINSQDFLNTIIMYKHLEKLPQHIKKTIEKNAEAMVVAIQNQYNQALYKLKNTNLSQQEFEKIENAYLELKSYFETIFNILTQTDNYKMQQILLKWNINYINSKEYIAKQILEYFFNLNQKYQNHEISGSEYKTNENMYYFLVLYFDLQYDENKLLNMADINDQTTKENALNYLLQIREITLPSTFKAIQKSIYNFYYKQNNSSTKTNFSTEKNSDSSIFTPGLTNEFSDDLHDDDDQSESFNSIQYNPRKFASSIKQKDEIFPDEGMFLPTHNEALNILDLSPNNNHDDTKEMLRDKYMLYQKKSSKYDKIRHKDVQKSDILKHAYEVLAFSSYNKNPRLAVDDIGIWFQDMITWEEIVTTYQDNKIMHSMNPLEQYILSVAFDFLQKYFKTYSIKTLKLY